MKCPSCKFENSVGANFCKNCGAKLTIESSNMTNQQNNRNTINGNYTVNKNANHERENVMTIGCKVWFWLVLILNSISALTNFALFSYSSVWGIILKLSSIVIVAGAAMILFKQRKVGLYMIIAMDAIGCIVNITYHVNVVYALISSGLNVAISYYFVNKNSSVIK